MDDQTIRISIVVACRNEARHIGELLDSLRAQEMDGLSWEAIIADGMSTDGTREILDRYAARDARVRVVSNPGKIVSTGLNAGIRAARGEIILRMDAHTIYAPDYCKRCLEALERTGADNVGGPARTRVQGLRARTVAAAYHSKFSTGGARFHDENYEGWVETVTYGCWRKAVFDTVGLFDEALVRNQDDEFNLRLTRAGGRIWQNPLIRSWYSPRSRLSGLFRQYFQYGFWKVAVIRKHRIPASWRHLVPVAFIAAIMFSPAVVAIAVLRGAGRWATLFADLWLLVLAAYGAASLMASVAAARRHGWDTLVYLPVVFAVYHLSYGLGFLAGLLRFAAAQFSRPVTVDSVFARITR
jgi:glycosyltransferase involved in cell wall biosynthesis